MKDNTTFAIITAIFENSEFQSIPFDLEDGSDSTSIVKELSENGTSKLNMLKFPVSDTAFIIFSREQLDKTLFLIDIIEPESEPETPVKKTRTRKTNK